MTLDSLIFNLPYHYQNVKVNLNIYWIFFSFRNMEIPLPVSKALYPFVCLLPVFFNFAVVYDLYNSVMDFIHPSNTDFVIFNSTTLTHSPGPHINSSQSTTMLSTNLSSTTSPSVDASNMMKNLTLLFNTTTSMPSALWFLEFCKPSWFFWKSVLFKAKSRLPWISTWCQYS